MGLTGACENGSQQMGRKGTKWEFEFMDVFKVYVMYMEKHLGNVVG